MNNNNRNIKRRQFLKSSAVVSLGAVSTTAQASSSEFGPIQLTTVAESNNILGLDEEKMKYLDYSVYCKPRPFDVYPEKGKIIIYERSLNNSELRVLRNNSSVVYYEQFEESGLEIHSKKQTRAPVVELTKNGSPSAVISLAEEYSVPEVTIDTSGNKGRVRANIAQEVDSVDLGELIRHKLPPKSAKAKAVQVVEKSEMDQGTNKEKWAEEIALEPEIEVRNYGALEVEMKDSL